MQTPNEYDPQSLSTILPSVLLFQAGLLTIKVNFVLSLQKLLIRYNYITVNGHHFTLVKVPKL